MGLVSERMNLVTFLVMRDDMESVVEEIARRGVLHLTKLEEVDKWAQNLGNVSVETLSGEYAKRRRRIVEILEQLGCEDLAGVGVSGHATAAIDLKTMDQEIASIEEEVQPILLKKRQLVEKKAELEALRDQIEALGPRGLPIGGLMRTTLLAAAIGVIEERNLEQLRGLLGGIPSVVLPLRVEGKKLHVICIVLRRDKARLEEALKKVGFEETKITKDLAELTGEVGGDVTRRMLKLEQDLEDIGRKVGVLRHTHEARLKELLGRVEAATILLKMEAYCKVTEKTCLFSGWVPKKKTKSLIEAVKARTGGRAVAEVVEADEVIAETGGKVDVPVLLEQPSFLKPFEMLVSGYGIPAYGTIDPTIFVGVTFLFMFGMMFGDVGHGLVLFLGSIIILLKSRRLREAAKLGIYCASSSILFGLLYGSIFGHEDILPTLWLKPLDSITDLFKVAIGFGVIVVSLGIILNIINSLRTHAFLGNLFDQAGPLIGVIYWASVGFAVKWLISGKSPFGSSLLYYLIGIPLALFAVRAPILKLIGERRDVFPDGVATYILESAVEILEIFMGYLANTVSFIRVAAFGLAHAGLFIAVFSLADVVASKPGGTLLSWLVVIFGNIVIILLEGLVVTIQALRLEYYEFFGKFFKGLGSRYQPAGFS